ncbi:MAG: helix-turn-helix transcriptional regulator [Lachnospiraceae bacterium]|nr:helix-turn-helix transcriptional regulator [Lachnospiraceae bacterium]
MERKTIGSFIATLRKASGLTQKQLADMLMVTDKTVSRWERDETLPDLTLIPVIAEIFGVTSDELLRGERKASNTAFADSHSEKQRKRILNGTKKAYQTRSLVSVVISVIGLILAFTCMMAIMIRDVDEYVIGCALGLIANLAAAVYQRVGTINALAAIDCEEFSGDQVNETKKEIIRSEASVMKTVVIISSVVLWAAATDKDGIVGWIFMVAAVCVCWMISDHTKRRIKKIKLTNSTFDK